jgi:hypothetical protein
MSRVRNVLAWVAVAFMVMACPPFALVVDVIFFALFVLWFITSNQSSASQTSMRLQRGSTLVLAVLLIVLPAIELSHRRMPRTTGSVIDHLVVIGDSISSGIDPHLEAWPLVLQQTCRVGVRNLARPGAQVTEGLLMARGLTEGDHLVLIEIGGNDLLMAVSSDEYGKALDAFLSKVAAPNRTVLTNVRVATVAEQDCLWPDSGQPERKISRSAHSEAILRASDRRCRRND